MKTTSLSLTKTFITILLNLILVTPILFAQQTGKETVYFEYGKYVLTENAKSLLDKSCEKINNKQLLQITLTGHTDADGSDGYNSTLSQNRTKAVLDYLSAKGVDKEKIKIEFYGEEKPIAQNNNEQGKQQNRRVEIEIEYKEIVISDIFKKLEKESQSFKISANEDSKIKGKEGTTINISRNSLVKNNDDVVSGEVEIELKEFYTKADIVSANLHTMSDGKILETGGMIYISATSDGEKLVLKKGTKVEIEFVSKNRIPGMETFIGEKLDNQLNWILQNNTPSETTYVKVPTRVVIEGDSYVEYYDDTSATTTELNKLDRMIIESGVLGWINCDRFYEFQNKTDLIVETDTTYRPFVRLIFKDINSVMPGRYNKDKESMFKAIPVGQKATLIAFSLVNDEPYFVSKEIVISKDQRESLELIKTTMPALKSELQKLN